MKKLNPHELNRIQLLEVLRRADPKVYQQLTHESTATLRGYLAYWQSDKSDHVKPFTISRQGKQELLRHLRGLVTRGDIHFHPEKESKVIIGIDYGFTHE